MFAPITLAEIDAPGPVELSRSHLPYSIRPKLADLQPSPNFFNPALLYRSREVVAPPLYPYVPNHPRRKIALLPRLFRPSPILVCPER
jgi:hypothetical protein